MLENISKVHYKILEFLPFVDYIKSLDNFKCTLISDEEKYDWRTIEYQIENEFIKILILKDKEKEWVGVYRSNSQKVCYEQIDFLIYTEENRKYNGLEYNNVIRYSAHFDDEKYSKLVTSAFTYLDNEYLTGWRQKRKIAIEDLSKIITDEMNLSELIMRAEQKLLDFYEAINLEEGEVHKLVLGYDE
ncbi:MAG: hypothetical protein J1F35_02905 [Erysipelotrichales bacterium]|nr:hypothetical protein [Erysipelotrichales bacterium]